VTDIYLLIKNLKYRCFPGYPHKCPKLRIVPEKNLSKEDADRLLSLLFDQVYLTSPDRITYLWLEGIISLNSVRFETVMLRNYKNSSGYVYASFCLVFGVKTVDPIKAASTPYMGSAEFFYARFVGVWNNCPIIILHLMKTQIHFFLEDAGVVYHVNK